MFTRLSKSKFQVAVCMMVYIAAYLLTYLFVHNWLDVSKYIEGNLIAAIPILVTSLYFISIRRSMKHISFLFSRIIIPLFVAEKIILPVFTYAMFNRYANHSFTDIAGFDEGMYISMLLKGMVGGIQFYSVYYLVSSPFILLLIFLGLDKVKNTIEVSTRVQIRIWGNLFITAAIMIYGITDNVFGGITMSKAAVILTIYMLFNSVLFFPIRKSVKIAE